MSQTGNEKSSLIFRNFPQKEMHEIKFHLPSYLCKPMKREGQKKKKDGSFTIAKHGHYLTGCSWAELVSTLCQNGNILEWNRYN